MDQVSLKKIASLREVGLAILVLGVILFTFFNNFYSSQTQKINDLKTQKTTLETEVKSLRSTVQNMHQQNNTKNKTVKVDSPNVKIHILKGGQPPAFSKMNAFLEQITSPNFQNQLKLNEITTQGAAEEKGYIKNPVSITAQGAFEGIANFLKRLDDIEALVSVDSLFISISDSAPDKMDLELSTTLYQVEGIHAANETPANP
jgi:Tfp pilus assembly protein PilO